MKKEPKLVYAQGLDSLLRHANHWDDLLERSSSHHVFLSSGWLSAAATSYTSMRDLVWIGAWRSGMLLGALALCVQGQSARFLGDGPSDYLDFVFEKSLSESERTSLTSRMLALLVRHRPEVHTLHFRRVPSAQNTPARLMNLGKWRTTVLLEMPAPTMDMVAAPRALKKKSLRRHENRLRRQGDLSFFSSRASEEVSGRLDAFFDQHVRRWKDTPSPSLFLSFEERAFYRQVARNLSASGHLRYLEVLLDGKPVAAHFGMSFGGRFTWYKPSFDPLWSKYSPGEVLLKRLIEEAQAEGAQEFDFTIGDERFKSRFETRRRAVVDLHVTRSRWEWAKARGAREARLLGKEMLSPRAREWVKQALRRV